MKLIKTVVGILFIILVSSCEDYLQKYPLDSISSGSFPQSKDELELAINGAYNGLYYMQNADLMQAELFWDGITDLAFVRGTNADLNAILEGNSSSTLKGIFQATWAHHFSSIQRSNFILDNITRAKENIDDLTFINRVEAEAKVLKSWHYMYLTEFFGDVPFMNSSVDLENSFTPRNSKEEIVNSLIDDLDDAASKLPESYSGNNVGRITKGAALALKSRIALYSGKYEIAANAAKEVMEMGYSLHPDYGDLFQHVGDDNDETIFQLLFDLNVVLHRSSKHYNARKGLGYSVFVPTVSLVDSYLCSDGKSIDESPLYDPASPYENRDPRLKQSIIVPGTWFANYLFETHPDSLVTWYNGERVTNLEVTNAYATFTGYLWRKNCDETNFTNPDDGTTLPIKLIRYAEVLLTYVEAKIELNEIDQSVYDAINLIRARANMPDVPSGVTQAQFRKVLRNERKIELAGEGLRLFDIRRWRIAEYVMKGNLAGRKYEEYWFNPSIPDIDDYGNPVYANQDEVFKVAQVRRFDKNKDYLWPIPQAEIDVNSELTQNPGY